MTSADPSAAHGDRFYGVWKRFVTVMKKASQAIPGFVVIGALLSASIIWALAQWSLTMIAATGLVVLVVSLIIYAKTDDYGQAALALMAGLFPVLSVEWTVAKFVGFAVIWVGFTLLALMILSIKLAAESEDIYVQAALAAADDPKDADKIRGRLEDIAESAGEDMLGPIEAAKVIRIFMFRNLPVDSVPAALASTEKLHTITKVDADRIAVLLADVYKLLGQKKKWEYDDVLDDIYNIMKDTPAGPEEFIRSFENSRRLILSGEYELREVLRTIRDGLANGIPVDRMEEYVAGTA